ncbi:MAG TPA: hypothetical protein VF690_14290 [Hymenobacter sp.]|jgi:hypothetical protein
MTLLPPFPVTMFCTITVQTTSLLGNLFYENTRTTRFQKQPLEKVGQGWRYAVTMLDFQQTERHGLAQLDADTAALRRQLIIDTDHTGQLVQVCNKPQLREQWNALRPQLLKKHRDSDAISPAMIDGIGQVLHGDGYLEEVLRRGYEYGTLFPALYGQPYGSAPTPGPPRTIARFLGDLDLPLSTTVKRQSPVPADVAHGLLVEGQLNLAEYPADAVRQALRTMTDQHDLDTTLRAEHVESYEFDDRHELRHGAQFTLYGVEGVFMNKTLCTLAAQSA